MRPQKILIITSSREPNIERVTKYLDTSRVVRLNTDLLLEDNNKFDFYFPTTKPHWSFTVGGKPIDPEEISAVWYRRPDAPQRASLLPALYRSFVESESKKFLHMLWSTWHALSRRVLWVNDPRVLHEVEYNKPYQSQIATEVGLTVPPGIITNDHNSAVRFFEEHDSDIILKTFGGIAITDEEGREYVVLCQSCQPGSAREVPGRLCLCPCFPPKTSAQTDRA